MDSATLTTLIQHVLGIFAGVAYIIGRAKVKASGENAKPGYKTTEFWLTTALNIPVVLHDTGIIR